jgi:hypothetical protein
MGLQELTPLSDFIPIAADREILKRKLVDIEEQSAKQRMSLLTGLAAAGLSSARLDFHLEKANWLLGNIAGDRQDCQKVRGCPILTKDLTEVRIRSLLLEAEVAGLMLRIVNESDLSRSQLSLLTNLYEEIFDNACDRIDDITTIETIPLESQVKIQAGIILSGLFTN